MRSLIASPPISTRQLKESSAAEPRPSALTEATLPPGSSCLPFSNPFLCYPISGLVTSRTCTQFFLKGFARTHGFAHGIATIRSSPGSFRWPHDHPYRASSQPLRAAPPRSLGLPRAALLLRLARRQDSLQTNRHRRPLGHLAAPPQHARLHTLLRPPRQASLRRPPVSRLLLRGAHPLDLFRHLPPDHHQRRR